MEKNEKTKKKKKKTEGNHSLLSAVAGFTAIFAEWFVEEDSGSNEFAVKLMSSASFWFGAWNFLATEIRGPHLRGGVFHWPQSPVSKR